ncbi:MAG: hypothetical protein EOM91_21405 [Sphingobacteriia bacterium]|nr:hypothetical protein [Sphingobacteriia bacterium]
MSVINLDHKRRMDALRETMRFLDKFEPLIEEFALSFSDVESRLPESDGLDKEDRVAMIVRGLTGLEFLENVDFHVLYWRPFLAWLSVRDPAALDEMLQVGTGGAKA